MSLKGVLLDFDGTMADTAGDIAASVNYAIHQFYGPEYGIDNEQCRRTIGRGLRNELKDSLVHCNLEFDDALLDRGLKVLEDYYAEHPYDTTVAYDGIIDVLRRCNEKGLVLGVFSNKADRILKIVIEKLFSEVKFDYICGMQSSIPRKPSPVGLQLFMERFALEKQDMLYVGDSEVDWQTGVNAGVRTAIVTWGYRSHSKLSELGVSASALVDTMQELEAEIGR
ncbi:MAG: HAD-IIIA family hydrolase [Sphaerochaetaceae bacterium]|jgi:phosphoglycolate phosphatase|nr:HAD-IIIA family hydrolase [Sphaerochaetaceae bacterium]MDD3163186.1 HAD-IIIA family hydrolase [Sphaerochaetaceae bacterium]MDD4006544.1 HAD-IIIA family hydrolase [Sphaerochaetaceae bacterium]MDD4397738.1 HAD-IIIA family hydrolase [Sphaerochaetaceae bacterium]